MIDSSFIAHILFQSREHNPSAGSPRDLGSQADQLLPLQDLPADPVRQADQPLALQALPEDPVKQAGRSSGARRPKTVILNNNNSNSRNYNNNNIQHTAINIEDPAPSEDVIIYLKLIIDQTSIQKWLEFIIEYHCRCLLIF